MTQLSGICGVGLRHLSGVVQRLSWAKSPTKNLFYPQTLRHNNICLGYMQWTYSIRTLSRLIQHAWDTVDLFYPWALSHFIQHAWDTVDLFYPRALSRLIQHAWDTVDLFYPWALSHFIQHAWGTVDLFYPRTLRYAWGTVDLFYPDLFYSIPGPLVTSCDMHAWDTVDIIYPWPTQRRAL